MADVGEGSEVGGEGLGVGEGVVEGDGAAVVAGADAVADFVAAAVLLAADPDSAVWQAVSASAETPPSAPVNKVRRFTGAGAIPARYQSSPAR